MGELKPCPFCGAKNIMECRDRTMCVTLDCEATSPTGNWNTRPIEDELRGQLEAVREWKKRNCYIGARGQCGVNGRTLPPTDWAGLDAILQPDKTSTDVDKCGPDSGKDEQ